MDALTELYERMHGLSFDPPDPDLGHARVAPQAGGSLGSRWNSIIRPFS